MFATAVRGLKVGAACWIVGVVTTMLLGTIFVGGLVGAMLSTFPGAVAIYLDAHGFMQWAVLAGDPNVTGTDAVIGPLAVAVLTLVPLAVLLGGGAYIGRRADGAIAAASAIAIGYATATAAALLLLLASPFVGAGGDLVQGELVFKLAVAAVVAPIVLGAAGARLARAALEV